MPQTSRSTLLWLKFGLFGLVFALEMSTPTAYVMGYLYIILIVFASPSLTRSDSYYLTIAALVLTLSNIWIPGVQPIQTSMVVNRLIAVFAIGLTGILSDRYRHVQRTIILQQTKLHSQEKLMNVREDFAYTLAHDLKTPLLGAIETLQAFQREHFGSVKPQQKSVLHTLIRSHQTSLKLVETLLDVYRNETDGLELHLDVIDLINLVENVAKSLLSLAINRRVYLSVNYGDSDFRSFLWVEADIFQLQRVFTNLITNAINHSPRGSKIEIILEAQSTYHIVKVVDDGAGIKSNEMPYLFERFYQGTSDRQASGSGLGFYLARQIVEAHGGIIWAENRSPAGAIFGFRLAALLYSPPI